MNASKIQRSLLRCRSGLMTIHRFGLGEEFFKNLDELYRYTVDKNLKPSTVIEDFIPETFQVELQNHRKEFDRMTPLIVDSASHPPIDRPKG
jgi:hypothetical protein